MIIIFGKVIYRYVLEKLSLGILRDVMRLPWMTYEETIIVEDILHKLKPKKCLEWGAGYSSLSFPRLAGNLAKWISVEHDEKWAMTIKGLNKNPNVIISHIAPNNMFWSDDNADGSFDDLRDYIEFPAKFRPFNFILIDGRARKECLLAAYDMIEEDGIVLLHDAERKYYHSPLSKYKYQFSFSEYTGGRIRLWLGSKNLNVKCKFNVVRYIKISNVLKYIGETRRRFLW